jgi:hypothetical protein
MMIIQAALLTLLSTHDILSHIDFINDVFLLSPRSDFMLTISQNMAESIVDICGISQSGKLSVDKGNPNRNFRFQKSFFGEVLLLESFSKSKRMHKIIQDHNYCKFASMILTDNREYRHFKESEDTAGIASGMKLTPIDQSASMNALFSLEYYRKFAVQYQVNYPLTLIFDERIMNIIGNISRRLLEIGM